MRTLRMLRALREWWRKQNDAPRASREPGRAREAFGYDVGPRIEGDRARLARMQDSPSNTKPVKPIGRVA